MAIMRLSVTTSRTVRSAMKASAEEGRTARTRSVASRTAAILSATSALSTTGRGRAQDAGGAEIFDGLEVEVVEDRACLARDQRGVVSLDEQSAVPEDPIGQG